MTTVRIVAIRDAPRTIRVGNGPAFIPKALDRWAYENGATLAFSRQGKPSGNAFVESSGKLFWPASFITLERRAFSLAPMRFEASSVGGRGTIFPTRRDQESGLGDHGAFDGTMQSSEPGAVFQVRSVGDVIVIELSHAIMPSDLKRVVGLDPNALLVWMPQSLPHRGSAAATEAGGRLVDIGSSEAAASLDAGLVMVLPRRLSARVRQARVPSRLPYSTAFEAARMLASQVFASSYPSVSAQGVFVGRALAELVMGAFATCSNGLNELRTHREATLLDRLIDVADRDPFRDVSVAEICSELACSRSALYRATAPVGGVVALFARRRNVSTEFGPQAATSGCANPIGPEILRMRGERR